MTNEDSRQEARRAESSGLAETLNLSATQLFIAFSHKSKKHKNEVSEVFPGLLNNPLNKVPHGTLLDYLTKIEQSDRYSRSMGHKKFERAFQTLSNYVMHPGAVAPEESFHYLLGKCPPRKLI